MASRFSYANVASTIALFFELTGGVVYAASKIGTNDIQRQAVTEKKIAPRAVKNGKLALGSVKTDQLADSAVGNVQVKNDSIQPSKLTFPVMYVAQPTGGSQAVTDSQAPYPLTGAQWTQRKDAINVIFGEGTGTLAYDGVLRRSRRRPAARRRSAANGLHHPGAGLAADRCRAGRRTAEPDATDPDGPGQLKRRLHARLEHRFDAVPGLELRLTVEVPTGGNSG